MGKEGLLFMLRVLSVDWDYFIDADAVKRGSLFPDIPNEKLAYSLQNMIWASRYSDVGGDAMSRIGLLPVLDTFLKDVPRKIPYVFVVNSHRYAYDFIIDLMRKQKRRELCLTNLDFHHDTWSNKTGVDCGNWLRKLMDKYNGRYTWVGHADSGQTERDKRLFFTPNYKDALVKDIKWDVLFVCRSDMWSPPHLDKAFIRSFKPLSEIGKGLAETRIWEDRYEVIKDTIQQLREAREAAMLREVHKDELKDRKRS